MRSLSSICMIPDESYIKDMIRHSPILDSYIGWRLSDENMVLVKINLTFDIIIVIRNKIEQYVQFQGTIPEKLPVPSHANSEQLMEDIMISHKLFITGK